MGLKNDLVVYTRLECESCEEMTCSIEKAKEEGADLVELCIDDFTFSDISQLEVLLKQRSLPSIVSFRPKSPINSEGKKTCIQVLKLAVELDVEFVEVDTQVVFHQVVAELMKSRSNSKIIASTYVNGGNPTKETLCNSIINLQSTGADIIKLVIDVAYITDVAPVFHMLTHSQVPLIVRAAGDRGLISQLLGPKYGAFFVCGSLGGKYTPGLPSLTTIKQVYKLQYVNPETRIFGVISNPVGHSKGPLLHNPAFRHTGYNGIYVPLLVDNVKEFFRVFSCNDYAGFSVGIPHKEAAVRCCDEVDPLAKSIGAVNTIIRRPSDGKLIGYNTDCEACVTAIEDALRERQKTNGHASNVSLDNKLHPALFSPEAEHKVLQHLMDGLMSYTFQSEDAQCSLFHNIVRELLACVVMRPVLNIANPRFINERIESLVVSVKKGDKGNTAAETEPRSRPVGSSKISADHFSRVLDPSAKGVELVQLKNDQPNNTEEHAMNTMNGTDLLLDPLLSLDARSTRSWSSLPSEADADDGRGIHRHHSGGEWGERLDLLSRRKTEALAPENLDNIWAKGRNYKRKEEANLVSDKLKKSSLVSAPKSPGHSKEAQQKESERENKVGAKHYVKDNAPSQGDLKRPIYPPDYSYQEENEHSSDEDESESSSSYTTEDEEPSSVTGFDSPGTQVWDGKNIRNVNHIHHPLENNEGHKRRNGKASKTHIRSKHLNRVLSGRKRSRLSNQTEHLWQETQRTSFLQGDGQDILKSKENVKPDGPSDDSETEIFSRISSDTNASSYVSSRSFSEIHSMGPYSTTGSIIADSFLKLRSEVLSANIVRSGSKTFAVYSISVTDMNNNSWSIKRRFQHFEELHWRLKEFPEYNLHLPPKHFLSSSLDVPVIRERCKSLDIYLKKLLLLPTVSNSIEVWDFLSVDSQTYSFSNSLSIIETLQADLDRTVHQKSKEPPHGISPRTDLLSSKGKHSNTESKNLTSRIEHDHAGHASRFRKDYVALSPPKRPLTETFEDSNSDNKVHANRKSTPNMQTTSKSVETNSLASPESLVAATVDPTFPSEWVPPNLTVPILDLVDVIFQLQDGGWIRRNAFWVAKQVLQLGMGDAFDDWLIEKIQRLRRGSVVAAGIQRVEQILWPDGIFITKHPARQHPAPTSSPNCPPGQPSTPLSSPRLENSQKLDEMQKLEAEQRAKFVYELMIDKAPAAIVGLVGHKEYEQCAKDLYYFIQSSVCMKQLVLDLLELLLVSAFPELTSVFNTLHEEKERFGELKID